MASKQELLRKQQMIQAKQEEGNKLYKEKTEQLKKIFSHFQENLEKFAVQYKEEINSNPQFREKFSDLCNDIGIDPVMSRKTVFSSLGFGDFYNQLFMAILDICQKSRLINGGLMHMNDLIKSYKKKYQQNITPSDVKRALKTIKMLGTGCSIINEQFICTLPYELSDDSTELLSVADSKGFVTQKIMNHWNKDRFDLIIAKLVQQGLLWQDKKSKQNEILFFFSGTVNQFMDQKSFYNEYTK